MSESPDLISQATEILVSHLSDEFDSVDNLSRALRNVVIPQTIGADQYQKSSSRGFSFDSMVKIYLYKQIMGYSDNKLEERFSKWPYLRLRFDIDNAPRQQTFSYTWNHRFSDRTRHALNCAAEAIASIAAQKDVIREELAPGDPDDDDITEDDEPTREYKRRKSQQTVRLARQHAIPHFDTNRASNKSYSDDAIFEILSRMCASKGSAHSEGEYAWLTDDDYTPDGSTILRALKKIGDSTTDEQLTIDAFNDSDGLSEVQDIRDAVLTPFNNATQNIISSINGENPFSERRTIAAIDITYEQIHISPWADKEAGKPNPDYPRMASGYKKDDDYRRGFKYATITLVGDNAPIILGVEPVKENSAWEPKNSHSDNLADIVEQLIERAQQFVDLDLVLFDREFYAHDVFNAVDRRGVTYLTPKMKYEADYDNIANIEEHPSADVAVEHDVISHGSDSQHSLEFLYVPSSEEEGKYVVFATNMDHVDPSEIQGITRQYRRRWDIENQYKSIKSFLPRTSSMDFRVRFLNFVFATIIYNLWRLTDYLLKQALDLPIRSDPIISAKVFAKAVGNFLRRIG